MNDREWEALARLWGQEQRIDIQRLIVRARRERRWWLAWVLLDLVGIAAIGITVTVVLLSAAALSFKVICALLLLVSLGYLPLVKANWLSQLPQEFADTESYLEFHRRQIKFAQRYVILTWWAMSLFLLIFGTWAWWLVDTPEELPPKPLFYVACIMPLLGGILFNLWLGRWIRQRRRELDVLMRLLKE
jgi:preprotein translocase subunit SecY